MSTNWLEYFSDSDRDIQISGVRQALTDKGFRVRSTALFAVLNVGEWVAACGDAVDVRIRFMALGEDHDPSHAGIFGYHARNATVAAILALMVRPDEIYPATH